MFSFDWRHRRLRCGGHIINLAAQSALTYKPSASTKRKLNEDAFNDERVEDVARQNDRDTQLLATAFSPVDLQDEGSIQVQQAEWRKRGAIGKAHNIVNHICASDQRRENFRKAQKEVEDQAEVKKIFSLVCDGGVRWNSSYCMIHRSKFCVGETLRLLH